MTTAIIVGNGKTRKEVDITNFKSLGPVYACNAAYRDFKPDFLVAIDDNPRIFLSKGPVHCATRR